MSLGDIAVYTSFEKLVEKQREMASGVICQDFLKREISIIGGADVAYKKNSAVAVTSIHDYHSLRTLGINLHRCQIVFPYTPGLLAFREAEAIVSSAKPFLGKMDVLMVDGHGVAHPRRCGLASFVGLFLDMPTIGVAKELLCGETASFSGKFADVLYQGELVARAFKRNSSARPIYISVGHKISLDKACKITEDTTKKHRIPEPLFEAHRLGKEEFCRRRLCS